MPRFKAATNASTTPSTAVTMNEKQPQPPPPPVPHPPPPLPPPQPPEPKTPEDTRPALFDAAKYSWNPLQEDTRDPAAAIVRFHSTCDYIDLHDNLRCEVFKCLPTSLWNKPSGEQDKIIWTWAVKVASRRRAVDVVKRRKPDAATNDYTPADLRIAKKEIENEFPFRLHSAPIDNADKERDRKPSPDNDVSPSKESSNDDDQSDKEIPLYKWNPLDEDRSDPNSRIFKFHAFMDAMGIHGKQRSDIYSSIGYTFRLSFPQFTLACGSQAIESLVKQRVEELARMGNGYLPVHIVIGTNNSRDKPARMT
jgi:hypothetical protein